MKLTGKEEIIIFAALTQFNALPKEEQAKWIQSALGMNAPSIDRIQENIGLEDNINIITKMKGY